MTDQLLEAGILLGVGMSVVFSFLTMLIGGVHSIAWFVKRFPEEPVAAINSGALYNKNNKSTNSTQTTVNPTIYKAISAAVHAHRRKSK